MHEGQRPRLVSCRVAGADRRRRRREADGALLLREVERVHTSTVLEDDAHLRRTLACSRRRTSAKRTDTHAYTLIHRHKSTRTYECIHKYTHAYTCTGTRARARRHTQIHTHINPHAPAHTHQSRSLIAARRRLAKFRCYAPQRVDLDGPSRHFHRSQAAARGLSLAAAGRYLDRAVRCDRRGTGPPFDLRANTLITPDHDTTRHDATRPQEGTARPASGGY